MADVTSITAIKLSITVWVGHVVWVIHEKNPSKILVGRRKGKNKLRNQYVNLFLKVITNMASVQTLSLKYVCECGGS